MAIINWESSKNAIAIVGSNIAVKQMRSGGLGVYVGKRVKLKLPAGTSLSQAKRYAVGLYQRLAPKLPDTARIEDIVPEEKSAPDIRAMEWDSETVELWKSQWPSSYITPHGRVVFENGQIVDLSGDAEPEFFEALLANQI
jgi:hypothetical protein